MHKLCNSFDPTTAFIVKQALKGAANTSKSHMRKLLPITSDILKSLVLAIPYNPSDDYNCVMYTALFTFCFHACLRVGEAVVATSSDHTLQRSSLTTIGAPTQAYRIQFKSYKHSEPGTSTVRLLKRRDDVINCPVIALNRYLQRRPQSPGPLFTFKNSEPLTSGNFNNCLQYCLRKCSLDPHSYGTHSFRIGKATQMSLDNINVQTIQDTGRWKTNAYVNYIRKQASTIPT